MRKFLVLGGDGRVVDLRAVAEASGRRPFGAAGGGLFRDVEASESAVDCEEASGSFTGGRGLSSSLDVSDNSSKEDSAGVG